MKSDEIRLTSMIVTVEWDNGRSALLERLTKRARAGDGLAEHALAALRTHRGLTHQDKQVIYDELDAWLVETDDDTLGEQLMKLRSELQTDLGLGLDHQGHNRGMP